MPHHPSTIALTLAACLNSAGAVCNASLTIDLRAVSTTAGYVINPKMVFFTGVPGQTVSFDLYAVITGQDGSTANEGLLSVSLSVLSNSAGLLGDLATERDFYYQGTGGSNGTVADLDGDGDLDVGSNNDASSSGFFTARMRDSAPYGGEIRFGTAVWTNTGGTFDTFVNLRPRNRNTAGSWFEDGFQITSSDFSAGAPVIITLPEPIATVGLGLGLLARRRTSRTKER